MTAPYPDNSLSTGRPPGSPVHEISECTSPINVTVRCSCGWSYTESRRQNAWARAAKIRAAIDKHAMSIR